MPSVFVVPVYVEVPDGFERAVATLEAVLKRAGYAFCIGECLPETLEETQQTLGVKPRLVEHGGVGTEVSP